MKTFKSFLLITIAFFTFAVANAETRDVTIIKADFFDGVGWNVMGNLVVSYDMDVKATLVRTERSIYFAYENERFSSTKFNTSYMLDGRKNYYFMGVDNEGTDVRITLSLPLYGNWEKPYFIVDYRFGKVIFTLKPIR